jgi:hypothetical protein
MEVRRAPAEELLKSISAIGDKAQKADSDAFMAALFLGCVPHQLAVAHDRVVAITDVDPEYHLRSQLRPMVCPNQHSRHGQIFGLAEELAPCIAEGSLDIGGEPDFRSW